MVPKAQQLVWSEAFALGDDEIDEQHQQLFEIYNGALKVLHEHPADLTPAAVLQAVFDYTEYHFVTEQALMTTLRYPDRHEHVREHQALLSVMQALVGRVDDNPTLLSDMVGLLRVWIQGHILHTDRRLGEFLKAQR